jgi:hypothetical protein
VTDLKANGIILHLLSVLVTIFGIELPIFAEKDICDTTILNHPACEVGDFDQGPMHGASTTITSSTLRTNRLAVAEANRCLKLKKYEKAIATLKSAIAADPADMFCLYVLSICFVHMFCPMLMFSMVTILGNGRI